MGYIEKNLNPGERILYATHLHWIVLIRAIFADIIFSGTGVALVVWAVAGRHTERGEAQMAGIVGVVLILFGSLILAFSAIRRNATEMAVTNKRIIVKVGVLTKRTVELFLARVESIEVEQTLAGRMMGYGSLTVRGVGGTLEPFSHVANPLEFRRQVQHQIEEHSSAGVLQIPNTKPAES